MNALLPVSQPTVNDVLPSMPQAAYVRGSPTIYLNLVNAYLVYHKSKRTAIEVNKKMAESRMEATCRKRGLALHSLLAPVDESGKALPSGLYIEYGDLMRLKNTMLSNIKEANRRSHKLRYLNRRNPPTLQEVVGVSPIEETTPEEMETTMKAERNNDPDNLSLEQVAQYIKSAVNSLNTKKAMLEKELAEVEQGIAENKSQLEAINSVLNPEIPTVVKGGNIPIYSLVKDAGLENNVYRGSNTIRQAIQCAGIKIYRGKKLSHLISQQDACVVKTALRNYYSYMKSSGVKKISHSLSSYGFLRMDEVAMRWGTTAGVARSIVKCKPNLVSYTHKEIAEKLNIKDKSHPSVYRRRCFALQEVKDVEVLSTQIDHYGLCNAPIFIRIETLAKFITQELNKQTQTN